MGHSDIRGHHPLISLPLLAILVSSASTLLLLLIHMLIYVRVDQMAKQNANNHIHSNILTTFQCRQKNIVHNLSRLL